MKHSTAPLAWQITNLFKSFQKLRRRKYLSDRITGGVWFFQTHKSKTDGLWHNHLHVLIDAEYLDKNTVSNFWRQITLTSHIVDIKTVKDPDHAARHVARYAATPANLDGLNDAEACELVDAFRHRRLVGTFGSAREISLRSKKPDDWEDWETLGDGTMIEELKDSDPNARAIFYAERTDTPLPAGINMRHIDRAIAGWADEAARAPPKPFQRTFFDYPAA